MANTTTYNVEDIFEDIAGDDKNMLMNIPPEILESMDWKPGDTLLISVDNGQITLTKKEIHE